MIGLSIALTGCLFLVVSIAFIQMMPSQNKVAIGVLNFCFLASVATGIVGLLMLIWGYNG